MRYVPSVGIALATALAMFSTTSVMAADKDAPANAPARMEMTDDGPTLVTPAGMTLYVYGRDATTPGKSQCSSVPETTWRDGQGEWGILPVVRPEAHKSCVQQSPPYLADAGAKANGDFAFIDRPEGGKQWTWRGKPLYLSSEDHKPGDRYGLSYPAFAGGGGGGARGWSLAAPPLDLPGGLKLMHLGDGLALATANGLPVYTSKGRPQACQGCEELFKPIMAPDIAKVTGDWSIVDAGVGRSQYAFKGKPLYAAPESMAEYEIADDGGWEPVFFRKGPVRPSEIETRPALIGDVYTDKTGRTLYVFTCSTPTNDGVTCNNPGDPAGYWAALCGTAQECAKRWHLYLASDHARPSGNWSVVDVATPLYTDPRGFTYPAGVPRVKAWAYRGMPVYTYYEDTKPGDVRGHWIQWLGFSKFYAVLVPGTTG